MIEWSALAVKRGEGDRYYSYREGVGEKGWLWSKETNLLKLSARDR